MGGASSWHGLIGTPGYQAGASGTFTLPANAIVIAIIAHATSAATLSIFGGSAIPVPTGSQFSVDFKHALMTTSGSGTAAQIVATGTDSVFIHYVKSGHAS